MSFLARFINSFFLVMLIIGILISLGLWAYLLISLEPTILFLTVCILISLVMTLLSKENK